MCTKSFVLNTKLLHGHFFVVVKIYTFRLVFQPRCFSKYVWLEFPSYDYSLLPSIDLFCNVHVLMAESWIHMHYYFWTNVLSIFTWILASEGHLTNSSTWKWTYQNHISSCMWLFTSVWLSSGMYCAIIARISESI